MLGNRGQRSGAQPRHPGASGWTRARFENNQRRQAQGRRRGHRKARLQDENGQRQPGQGAGGERLKSRERPAEEESVASRADEVPKHERESRDSSRRPKSSWATERLGKCAAARAHQRYRRRGGKARDCQPRGPKLSRSRPCCAEPPPRGQQSPPMRQHQIPAFSRWRHAAKDPGAAVPRPRAVSRADQFSSPKMQASRRRTGGRALSWLESQAQGLQLNDTAWGSTCRA